MKNLTEIKRGYIYRVGQKMIVTNITRHTLARGRRLIQDLMDNETLITEEITDEMILTLKDWGHINHNIIITDQGQESRGNQVISYSTGTSGGTIYKEQVAIMKY